MGRVVGKVNMNIVVVPTFSIMLISFQTCVLSPFVCKNGCLATQAGFSTTLVVGKCMVYSNYNKRIRKAAQSDITKQHKDIHVVVSRGGVSDFLVCADMERDKL